MIRCADCICESTCGITKKMREQYPGLDRVLEKCFSYKPKPQVYTVNVFIEDKSGAEHEKDFRFNNREAASEFVTTMQIMLTRLRKTNAIRMGVVKATPPLPC